MLCGILSRCEHQVGYLNILCVLLRRVFIPSGCGGQLLRPTPRPSDLFCLYLFSRVWAAPQQECGHHEQIGSSGRTHSVKGDHVHTTSLHGMA